MFNRQNNCVYQCKYHILFTTKYRHNVLLGEIREFARQAIIEICEELSEIELHDLNVLDDHVHLIVTIPPKYSISSFIGTLKGRLSSRILNRYKKFKIKFWGGHLWSHGYFVRTIGLDENKVREYIKNQ